MISWPISSAVPGLRRLAVTPINPERLLPVNTIAVSQLGAASRPQGLT
ncbi:MAG: hypothetical protein R2709_01000 [Marmoricola sp.]